MIRELFHNGVSDFSFERFQLHTRASKAKPETWEAQVMMKRDPKWVLMGTVSHLLQVKGGFFLDRVLGR